jgi:NAD(P)H-flavin reductase
MSMLRALVDRGDTRPIILFCAYRRWERLTFREAIETLRSQISLRVVYVLGEPPEHWEGEIGLIETGVLSRHLPPDRRHFHYFICGRPGGDDAGRRTRTVRSRRAGHLHTELFDMA